MAGPAPLLELRLPAFGLFGCVNTIAEAVLLRSRKRRGKQQEGGRIQCNKKPHRFSRAHGIATTIRSHSWERLTFPIPSVKLQ